MRLTIPATLALASTAAVAPADARYYGGGRSLLVPHHRRNGRNYLYNRSPSSNRDPFDLAMDFLRIPIYDTANSILRQSEAALDQLATNAAPRYSVTEEGGVIELAMELPGTSAKDLTIELEDNSLLHIRGSRSLGHSLKSEFDQTFQLHEEIDPSSLKVTLANGILKVVGSKKEKIVKRLDIETGSVAEEEELKITTPASKNKDEHKEEVPTEETVDGMTITTEDAGEGET